MVSDKERYETLHDEHAPPQDGIEKTIVAILKERGALAPRILLAEVKKRGFSDADARTYIWRLLDRGWLRLTKDAKLELSPQRVNPAPTDLL